MTVEPRAGVVIELGGRELKGLAASTFAAEAVCVFEAAREHFRETPDLHVQGPGDSDVHAGSHRIIAAEPVVLLSLNRWFIRLVHFRRGR